jgi:paraquat-inducible protein A
MTFIACPDCAAIQRLKSLNSGRLECRQCGGVLENRTGRSISGALACSITVLLLLFPMNLLPLMTVHIGSIDRSSLLASGLAVAWRQGWPTVSVVLALEAVVLPFLRFGLLSAALSAIRYGWRGQWVGRAFRYSELLDMWAMTDVLLIGGGIGYGRIASQVPITINAGGWCFVIVAMMTMVTRATLERRAVWQSLGGEASTIPPDAIACASCDLLLPPEAEGHRCPRCSATLRRRRPASAMLCTALLLATTVLTPLAYGYPMSEFWKGLQPSPHTVIDGIKLLFEHGFWYFGVIITVVSVVFPLSKIAVMSWFLLSLDRRSSRHLRLKTKLYRLIDEVGRWSTLDPFTVLIFAPMIQFGQLAHFDFMGGTAAFLATVILSMLATKAFDPRLLWDASRSAGHAVSDNRLRPTDPHPTHA